MYELFLFGGFWFWTLVVIEVISLFSFVENKNGSGATISLIIFALLLHNFGNVNILAYMAANPVQILCIAILYLLIGAAWGTCKWALFIKERLAKYEEAKYSWLQGKLKREHDIPTSVPDELKEDWKEYLNGHFNRNLIPSVRARDYKSDIIRWMSFWWISLTWYLISDFVMGIFTSIYNKIAARLQMISDSIMSKTKSDFNDSYDSK